MSQNLPCTFLRWEKAATFTQILKTPDDSPKGYIVEVVLEFPQHLHDKYKEFSTMPGIPDSQDGGSVSSNRERSEPRAEQSETTYHGSDKLVPHLHKHDKYVIHYRNLKSIHELAVKITNMHRVI